MRLIDADYLKEALGIFNDGDPHFLNGIKTAREIIDDAPTIEAEPVRRGKWLPHPTEKDYDVCSACGTGTRKRTHCCENGLSWDEEEVYQFCPHCGARCNE